MKLGGLTPAQFRRWVARQEPGLIAGLNAAWARQEDVLSLDVIAEALDAGDLSPATYEALSLQYAAFVSQELGAAWGASALLVHRDRGKAITQIAGNAPPFSAFRGRLDAWASTRSGRLLRDLSAQQSEAIRQILGDAIPTGLSPSSVARLLRPALPLDARSSRAVSSLRQRLAARGVDAQDAERQVSAYASSLRNVRAQRIARTESAEGYHAADQAILEESVEQGLLTPDVVRVWDTSGDERTCRICAPLDGVRVGLRGEFASGPWTTLHPPLHPSCRCTLLFEVEPARRSP